MGKEVSENATGKFEFKRVRKRKRLRTRRMGNYRLQQLPETIDADRYSIPSTEREFRERATPSSGKPSP